MRPGRLGGKTITKTEGGSASVGPHSVVIADDHPVIRQALRDALSNDDQFCIVDEASNGLEAIAQVRKHRPTLLLLDLAMPYAQGLGVYLEARQWSPETRVVILTGMTSRVVLADLVHEGVDGLFMKTEPPEQLVEALPSILAGQQIISSEAAGFIDECEGKSLSPREHQVLTLVAMGHTNKAIAEHLGISFKTVDSHRTSLMRKLGLHSAAELLAYALREGYLDYTRQV